MLDYLKKEWGENVSNSFSIYDVTGRIVYNKQINPSVNNYLLTINPEFSNGMYFVQTKINGEVITKKLVVE